VLTTQPQRLVVCLENKHFVPQIKKNIQWKIYENEIENGSFVIKTQNVRFA
jgi:hypothetical protein